MDAISTSHNIDAKVAERPTHLSTSMHLSIVLADEERVKPSLGTWRDLFSQTSSYERQSQI